MDDNTTPQQSQNPNDYFAADYTQSDQTQATPVANDAQMVDPMTEIDVAEQQTLSPVDETGEPIDTDNPTVDSTPSISSSSNDVVSENLSSDANDSTPQTSDNTDTDAAVDASTTDETTDTDAAVDASTTDETDLSDLDNMGMGSDEEAMSADGSFGMMGPDL